MRLWIGLWLCAAALAQTRVWVDADTANEIDDLYAITRVFHAKGIDVIALSSAQWKASPLAEGNTLEQSQLLNEALLGLLGKDIPHLRGSAVPVYWWGRDRAAYSGAAYHLLLEARKLRDGEKLNVLSLGALTNVASALLMDPAIAGKLRLYWLGAEFKDGVWNKNEFNCLNDIHGLNVVFDAKELELHVMPANVARSLTFSYADTAARLAPKGRLGDFLLERWKKHAPGASSWIMWDLAAVEWLLHPEWVEAKTFPPPPENTRRDIRVATRIDAAKMREDFWASW